MQRDCLTIIPLPMKSKTMKYLIFEGEFDQLVITRIIPKELLVGCKLVVGAGYTSSISIGKSIYSRGDNDVALVVDSDTMDEKEVDERYSYIKSSFGTIPSNSKLEIIMFTPEIEKVFFYDKDFVESFFERKFTNFELMSALRDPQFYMRYYYRKDISLNNLRIIMLDNLTEDARRIIQQECEELKKISNFLRFS